MKDRRKKGICSILCILLIAVSMTAGCGKEKTEDLTELELGTAGTDAAETDGQKEASKKEEEADEDKSAQKKEAREEKEAADMVYVYVCGAVKAPGVYELASDARVYEAIASAGGVRDDAAGEALNQARMVTDGERICIPTKEELEKGIVDGGEAPQVTEADVKDEGKININTADKETLKTLPGIGDAKADSIISHREANGPFQFIEDLMNVEGIKEGVFQKIEDKITATS